MKEWRQVPGYELYHITRCGRVKRLESYVKTGNGGMRFIPERELKPFEKHKGSGSLYIKLSSNNREISRSVQSLVDQVFYKKKKKRKSSKYPGIYKRGSRWIAQGYNYGKIVWLGSSHTEEGALKIKMKFETEKERWKIANDAKTK